MGTERRPPTHDRCGGGDGDDVGALDPRRLDCGRRLGTRGGGRGPEQPAHHPDPTGRHEEDALRRSGAAGRTDRARGRPGRPALHHPGSGRHGEGRVIRVDPAAAADAAAAPACPPAREPGTAFTDIAVSPHREAVECPAWWDFVSGESAETFPPAQATTRGQLASMVARLLQSAGVDLPAAPADAFTDDDLSVHEQRIDQLAALGILRGYGDGTFRPGQEVPRAEVTTVVVGAYESAFGDLVAGPDAFTDDAGSIHEANINAAAQAGWVTGVTAGTFDPDGSAQRAQIASKVARMLGTLVADEEVETPADGVWVRRRPGPPGRRRHRGPLRGQPAVGAFRCGNIDRCPAPAPAPGPGGRRTASRPGWSPSRCAACSPAARRTRRPGRRARRPRPRRQRRVVAREPSPPGTSGTAERSASTRRCSPSTTTCRLVGPAADRRRSRCTCTAGGSAPATRPTRSPTRSTCSPARGGRSSASTTASRPRRPPIPVGSGTRPTNRTSPPPSTGRGTTAVSSEGIRTASSSSVTPLAPSSSRSSPPTPRS